MRLSPAAPVMLLLLSVPAATAAQAVRGVVIDDNNRQPVPGAMVRVLVDGELRDGRETDERGRFILPLPGAGEYRLEVSRLGYATSLSQPVLAFQGDTVDVEFRVLPDAVLLDPITVTARSRRGRDHFQRRLESWDRGIFITPDMLDTIRPDHPAEVLEGLENVEIRWEYGLTSSGMPGRIPSVVRTLEARECLQYMVDFVPVRVDPGYLVGSTAWQGYQLGLLEGDDIVAAEVYRSIFEVPRELQRYTYAPGSTDEFNCGLVVFWTRASW